MRPDYPISYAGLDSKALWENAKRAFDHGQHPVPRRLRDFLPLFPMELTVSMRFLGLGAPMAAPSGFSTDANEYHAALSAALPKLYQDENRQRCFDYEGQFRGGEVRVDAAWARMFPQYAPFLGERLVVRLIGGGCEAAAVPQSLCLRCAELLDGAEREMGVTARVEDYIAYVHARLTRNESYDPAGFARDYLRTTHMTCAVVRQADLSRAMQDEAIVRSLSRERACSDELFTDIASRAGVVRQYQPFSRACDFFSEETVNRHTARLVQLCWSGDDRVDNLWLVYEDARAYMNRTRRVVDARALCEGFQLAPVLTAGRAAYPDSLRVAVVRSHDARLWVARTLNNPAYGSGLSPQGTLNRLVWLEDSEGMLRRHQLALENVLVSCTNTEVDAQTWERMARQARAQERKGRLIDTLYRRERALHRLANDALASGRALLLMDERVAALEKRLAAGGADEPGGEYDADVAYLRRKARAQVGELEPDEPPFALDKQRERSIECGYAMRAAQTPDEGWEPDPEPVPEAEAPEDAEEEEPEEAPWPDEWDEMLATFAEVEARMRGENGEAAQRAEAAEADAGSGEADGEAEALDTEPAGGEDPAEEEAAAIGAAYEEAAHAEDVHCGEPAYEETADSTNAEPACEAPASAEADQPNEPAYGEPSYEEEVSSEPAYVEEPESSEPACEETTSDEHAGADASEGAQAAIAEAAVVDAASTASLNAEPACESPASAEADQPDEPAYGEPSYEEEASSEPGYVEEPESSEPAREETTSDEYAGADASESPQAVITEAAVVDAASTASLNAEPACESPANAEAEPASAEFTVPEPANAALPTSQPPGPSPAARPPMVSTTPPPNHTAVPPQPRRIRGKKARHRKARERQMRFEQIGMFVKPAPTPLPELGDPPPAAPAPAASSEAEAPAPYAPRALRDVAPEADAHHPRSMAELLTPPQS